MAFILAAQAAGSEILVANLIRELAAGKGFLFADRGDVALRGFEEPVRLHEVGTIVLWSSFNGLASGALKALSRHEGVRQAEVVSGRWRERPAAAIRFSGR